MTFQPQHTGLYFGSEHIEQSRRRQKGYPGKAAWAFLEDHQPETDLSALVLNGLRWRFAGDVEAGRAAAARLEKEDGLSVPAQSPGWDDVARAVTLAHVFEMARETEVFSENARRDWLAQFAARVTALNDALANAGYVERLGLGLLHMVAGVVLEDAAAFERGVAAYREAVGKDITPDGYIAQAVQGADGAAYLRQLLAVKALVLMAEAATLAGEDLWQYTVRGVSVTTAAVYLNYYYYFPDKWRWDDGTIPDAAGLLRQHGGYLEILNSRIHPKDIEAVLYDLRPIYDVTGGGLTTLTHGSSRRRGWFG
jgi:hypothetical protein